MVVGSVDVTRTSVDDIHRSVDGIYILYHIIAYYITASDFCMVPEVVEGIGRFCGIVRTVIVRGGKGGYD